MRLMLGLVRSLSIHHSTLSPFSQSLTLHHRRRHHIMATSSEISPSTTRIGWIGTGVMGLSMCTHLLKAGYTVTVFTRTLSKAEPLIPLGAHLADSPSSVASNSDVVFSIVGFPSDVWSVLLDPTSGALSSLSPGGILVDMTTSEPSLASSISDSALSKGCHSVDAPVSGGDRGAKSASLSIFAGGEESIVSKLAPLFNLLGTVYYMGGPGKGQFAKLANQITIASTMVGLVEGMVYAHKAGLDLGLFLEAISKGAAGSKSLELYGDRILKRDLGPGFYVDHFVKDLGICLKECERMGIALPGLALAQQLYLSLKAHGQGKLGTQALILSLERINNVSLDPRNYSEAPRMKTSGQSGNDVVNNACIIYNESTGKGAKLKNEHAWCLPHNERKCQIPVQPNEEGSSKRTNDESGSYTPFSNPTTPISEGATDGSSNHPSGRMTTKRARKSGATSMSNESNEEVMSTREEMLSKLVTIRQQELKLRQEEIDIVRETYRIQLASEERMKSEYAYRTKEKEQKEIETLKKPNDERNDEYSGKWSMLYDLMRRSGSLTPHEEMLKESLIKGFISR